MSARLTHLTVVRKHLEKPWREEYLVKMTGYAQQKKRKINEGDVVLLVEDNKKRHLWRMARVTSLYPGKDGNSHVARVKIGASPMLRPI